MELTREFKDLTKNDASIAGGKGASLGEMIRAGISVPPGFVVLAGTFEKFLEETDLNVEVDAILDGVNHNEVHTVENASEKIQALIMAAEMPKDIEAEIENYFKQLDAKFVAVRSSATAEDSASAAWAGQLDSYLNTAEETLLKNVKRCWASLFTPRAIFYRFEKELHKTKISVAVVVQKMVESDVSGVAFSVHPVTEDRNQLIIEAGFGLGEAIVSGSITPDSYVVEKEPRRIIDKNVVEQARGIYRAESGGDEWRDIGMERRGEQKLSDDQILELSSLILKIENHYSFPCDIEWALEASTFYITQSRPITTLMTGEPGVFSEKEVLGTVKNIEANRILMQYSVKPPLIRKGFHAKFYPIDFVQLLWKRWGDYSGYYYKLHISVWSNDYWYIYYIPEEFTSLRDHYFAKIANDKQFLKKHYVDWSKSCDQLRESITKLDESLKDNREFTEILEAYKWFADKYIYQYSLSVPPQEACGFQPEQWIIPEIESYTKEYGLPYQKTFTLLTSPIVHSFITQEEIELLKLAREYQVLEVKDFSFLESRISLHQKKWFWIKNNYADMDGLGVDFFKNRVEEYLNLTPLEVESKIDQLERGPSLMNEEKKQLLGTNLPTDKLRLYTEVNEMFAEMQDIRKSFVLIANYYHKKFLELVAIETGQGLDNLWLYTYTELINAINDRKFISQDEISKRKQIIVEVEGKDEQVVLSGDEAQFFHSHIREEVAAVKSFSGLVAQTGVARGIVKIVFRSEDISKVNAGDILVASMTRPEMTTAMNRAAAFVTDEGGITSHAAIISRELKKPCIIGTKIATQILKDGDLVEVDADKGMVRVIDRK
ncbi:MAG: hypothetical protein HY226_05690 [Candidatus Vogelbacteria bacterium]|nr:hypothetical protein [Candidatus Vogelbacteria bacterium]